VAASRLGLSGGAALAVAGLYFLVPLAITVAFSLWEGGARYGPAAYLALLGQRDLWSSLGLTLLLAAETIAVLMALLVPSLILVHLRAPRLRLLFEIASILPFVIPAIALVAGLTALYTGPAWLIGGPSYLVIPYTILALPYAYRALDAGLQALDIRTLVEAAQSLGAGWGRILGQVVLPNLGAALASATLLTLTIVMGEFTFANVLLFKTFAVFINEVGQTQVTEAAALSMVSFAITWAAMLGVLRTGQRGTAPPGGTR
jgi:putative spermidine/putrescine transport system permease protein